MSSTTPLIFMGIDPDMHEMPAVTMDLTKKVLAVHIYEVSKKITGREALLAMIDQLNETWPHQSPQFTAVEGQELYQFGPNKTKNPKSIMFLANVAGMAQMRFGGSLLAIPTPAEWKKQVPKQIHQGRVLSRIGYAGEYEKMGTVKKGWCYCKALADKFPHVKKAQWKHVNDAIGLALWCLEQVQGELAEDTQ